MSPNHRHPTFKERRDRPSQSTFVGRDVQLQAFRSALTTPCEERNQFIFNVSGQGGIGKTTLLKQFRKIAEEAKQAVAYVDEGAQSNRVDDVPEALDRLAADFERQGHKFDHFRERYKVYRQKRQELEADPDAPQGFVAGFGRVVAKASLGAAKSIPGSGAVLDFVDADAVADKTGEFAAFVARKLTNKDEVQLVQQPLEVLTPLFLADFNRIAEKQTVVLLLDTYEQTGTFLDDWVRSLLDERYGALSSNFLLAIAGREPLNRNDWAALEEWLLRSELEPFTQEEAQQYLTSKGITHEAVIQEIWRLSSGGLPLLISMMAQAAPTTPDAITDHCEDAVERFLKWETDAAKRQIAMNASLPRVLNRDVLALLVAEADVTELFEWLKSRSFVVEHPEGWQYHSVVREQMLRYQRKVSPQGWAALHGKLAAYYDQLRQHSGLEPVAPSTQPQSVAEPLTNSQRQRLTTQRETLQANWDLETEKLKRLRHDVAIETDTTVKFKLQHGIAATETQLAQLTTQLTDLEKALDRVEVASNAPVSSEPKSLWSEPKHVWADETWQKYTLSWLYHSLCVAPQAQLGMALNGCVAALKHSRTLAEEWASVMAIAGDVAGFAALKYWGEQLRDGLQAYKNKEYKVAIDLFSTLLQAPQLDAKWRPVALNWHGVMYWRADEYEQSLQGLTEAINLAPDEAEYWLDRGKTHHWMKLYQEALADFGQALNLRSDNSRTYSFRSQTHRQMQNYAEAVVDADRAIQLDEKSSFAWATRGEAYRRMERYDDALANFDRALELDANYGWAIAHRGEIYRLMKRYDDALADFDRTIELKPDDQWAIAHRGGTYREMKRHDDALADLTNALKLNPQDAWTINERGRAYLNAKRYEQALDDFSRALELDSQYKWAIANCGETYRLMRRYNESFIDFNRAIELDANYGWAIGLRGRTYRALKRYDEAIRDFDRAIELDADSAWNLGVRGETYLLKGDFKNALKDLIQAITLNSTNDWYPYLRSLTHLKLNQLQLAQPDLATAIQLAQPKYDQNPTDWTNTFNFALYHISADHADIADILYRQSLVAPAEWIRMGVNDLQDFLALFPDHVQAQQMVALLQSTLEAGT